MATAYSYIRFSTPEQSKGDSLRRQLEKSQQYALANGLRLDDSLSFNDLGKSAFRGNHAATGGLSLFIAAIDEGRVEPGAYLLIENLDRLSRQPPVEALNLLQSIVSRGVIVVTLADGRKYTQDSLRNDPTSLLVSIIVMFRAHEESKVKGDRLRSAWTRKKQKDARSGKPITSMTPAWLRVENGAFKVIEEKAAVVRMVFDLATKEGLGQRAICSRLKQEEIPAIGRTGEWSETSVRRILTNQAVMGTYQPYSHAADDPTDRTPEGEPIDNYFPVIVPPIQFYEAQRLREKALIPRGPRGDGVGTIFTGITYCGNCGATMRRKGASKNDLWERLRCSKSCGAQSWKYSPLEQAVLHVLASDLLPQVKLKTSDRKRLQADVTEAKANLEKVRKSIGNLMKAIESGAEFSPSLQKALREAEQRERISLEELQASEHALSDMEIKTITQGSHLDLAYELSKTIKEEGSREKMRSRLRYALSRSVDRIVLEDSEDNRTVRLEIGKETRFIDFSRKKLKYVLRGVREVTGSIAVLGSNGEQKFYIP